MSLINKPEDINDPVVYLTVKNYREAIDNDLSQSDRRSAALGNPGPDHDRICGNVEKDFPVDATNTIIKQARADHFLVIEPRGEEVIKWLNDEIWSTLYFENVI